MKEQRQHELIFDIFTDISSHKLASELIRKHSSNSRDIREVALNGLDLTRCRNILDIGCGFGFFTEALKGRVHPLATVTGLDLIPGNEKPFLETCGRSGLKGFFSAQGTAPLRTFRGRSFDLILCSYALYFFPGAIPEISRALAESGRFIAVTHSLKNMSELICAVKDVLREKSLFNERELPIEAIISRFSAENGGELLAPWFQEIKRIEYGNTLIFAVEEISSLMEYFRFKGPFFLFETSLNKDMVADLLKALLQSRIDRDFTVSKDDAIFICSGPAKTK